MYSKLKNMLISTYDNIVKEYVAHEFDNFLMDAHYKYFMGDLPKGGQILDVGCGPGQAAKIFTSNGFKVVGIDLSEKIFYSITFS